MAFKLFSKFIKPNSYLGVDIGTTSIKVAEVSGGRGKPRLINYALFETYSHLERINTALQTSTLKLYDEEVAEYLKIILRRTGFISKRVVASLPAFAAFTTIIDIPIMSQEEVERTLSYKAKQYIPMPLTSVTIDWIKVGEKTDEAGNKVQQIFLVSVPNELVKKYQNIFQLAGLELMTLEVESFSLARILSVDIHQPNLIIDIGSRSTALLVAQDGTLQFASQTDFAGGSLTQSLAAGLGINIRRAEDLKRQKGLAGLRYAPEQELSTLLLPMLDVIINEAKRVKQTYENSYKQPVVGAVLSGGGANMLGIEKYFNQELSLPVKRANPFIRFEYPPQIGPLTANLGPALAVALGLGAKQFL